MKINRVTLTGADDQIDKFALLNLSKKYPFVEWGILFSSYAGRVRYPSTNWVERLTELKERYPFMQLSAHLCGKYAEQVLNGNYTVVHNGHGSFKRFQVNFNFNFTTNKRYNLGLFKNVLERFPKNDFILQLNSNNQRVCDYFIELKYPNLHLLHDASGGRGMLIDTFEAPGRAYTGYAGGLNPKNIFMVQQRMFAMHEPEQEVWVDMESGVRTDDLFDLRKCEAVLRTIAIGND